MRGRWRVSRHGWMRRASLYLTTAQRPGLLPAAYIRCMTINAAATTARESVRQSDGRFGVQVHTAPETELVDEDWLPASLPRHLRPVGYAADLLRRLCDDALPDGGAGACLPTSAIIGYYCHHEGIDARLVCGSYQGAAHWWVEADGYIFDGSAGQFSDDLPSVSEPRSAGYAAENTFPCGHTTEELLFAEARRSFGDPGQAHHFVELALMEIADARRLADFAARR